MSKLKIKIKDRWTDSVLFEYKKENNTLKDTMEKAIEEGFDLRGANLEGANLGGANLEGAYLGGAYLGGAYLEGAYIYVWDDDEPNIKEIVENIENNSNLKIKSHYINKHILSPYYLTYWKKGLIIDEYEIVEPKKEVKEMTIEEIEKVLGYSVKVVGGSDENEQVFKNRIYFNNCGFGNDYDWNINYGSRKD